MGMICPVKQTEYFCVVQKEEFSITCYMCVKCTFDERPSIFIRDKPIFSSERMLHKDYYRRSSGGGKQISGPGSQGA
jgi:hypothetical protein